MNDEILRLVGEARRHLEIERAFGVSAVPFDGRKVSRLRQAMARKRAPAGGKADEKLAALEALQREAEACRRCELGERRLKLVFGDGNPDADLMFIGEAPGQYEDEQGIPFIGPAGQLLTRIIEAMGLERGQVYIGNVLKCRPPGNRAPLPNEAHACLPYLRRQIDIIRPKIIVTLGNPATRALLNTTAGITKIRGRFVNWNGIEVMPTFHPSYLLRKQAAKREVWQDMQKVHARMKELGLPIGELKKAKR